MYFVTFYAFLSKFLICALKKKRKREIILRKTYSHAYIISHKHLPLMSKPYIHIIMHWILAGVLIKKFSFLTPFREE